MDECAEKKDDCHEDATCSDSVGSYSCLCNYGFKGDGKNCTGMQVLLQSDKSVLIEIMKIVKLCRFL